MPGANVGEDLSIGSAGSLAARQTAFQPTEWNSVHSGNYTFYNLQPKVRQTEKLLDQMLKYPLLQSEIALRSYNKVRKRNISIVFLYHCN